MKHGLPIDKDDLLFLFGLEIIICCLYPLSEIIAIFILLHLAAVDVIVIIMLNLFVLHMHLSNVILSSEMLVPVY